MILKQYQLCTLLLLLTLCGCTKQKPRLILPTFSTHHTVTQNNHAATITISSLTRKQFLEWYPKGLGKYTIVDLDGLYIHRKKTILKNRVRLLQGYVHNHSHTTLYISRESVSLPVLVAADCYRKNNFTVLASFIALALAGGTFLCLTPVAAMFSIGYGISFLAPSLYPLTLPCIAAGGVAAASATTGTIAHTHKMSRKEFAHAVMLPEKPHAIKPGETYSWLMMIPYEKYSSQFKITLKDAYHKEHIYRLILQ